VNDLLRSTAEALSDHPELAVFLISLLPIFEIRGGVIAGLALFGMSVPETLLWGFLGNIASVTPVLLFLEPISKWLYGNRYADRLFHWLFARAERKAAQVNRWGVLGLTIFVGIPLPGTGAWSGAIVAVFLGMHRWRALAACYAGVVMAGIIVTVVTLGGMAGARTLTNLP